VDEAAARDQLEGRVGLDQVIEREVQMSRVVGSLDDGRVSFGDRAEIEDARAIDPICGMEMSRADAVAAADHHGRLYFFCSEDCKERFDEDPDSYAVTTTDQPIP
jgi:YHS domain-containing protein